MSTQAGKDRKTAYATTPEPQDALDAALIDGSGELEAVEIANVSSLGATLLFDHKNAPCLAMGEGVELAFSAASTAKKFTVKADTVARSELDTIRQYSFKFPKQLLLHDPRLHRLFNRRSAYRVTPRDNEVIEVRIAIIDSEQTLDLPPVRCRDVSEQGICLETGIAADLTMKHINEVRISFQIPGSSSIQQFLASIVNRRITGENMILGLKFDAEGTGRFLAQQQEIVKYVMQRQREDLQQTAYARS